MCESESGCGANHHPLGRNIVRNQIIGTDGHHRMQLLSKSILKTGRLSDFGPLALWSGPKSTARGLSGVITTTPLDTFSIPRM
jgi:hypothetical protein